MIVSYSLEPGLSAAEYIDVLRRTTLGARRPVDDAARIAKMIAHADVLLTARVDGRLVGVSRALTDYSFATYLSDLAVDEQCQGHGIGRELIRRTHEACGKQTMLVLIAAGGDVLPAHRAAAASLVLVRAAGMRAKSERRGSAPPSIPGFVQARIEQGEHLIDKI